jgi:hypothetical protein
MPRELIDTLEAKDEEGFIFISMRDSGVKKKPDLNSSDHRVIER